MKNKAIAFILLPLMLVGCNGKTNYGFNIHTDVQLSYLIGNPRDLPRGIYGNAENSRPLPIHFEVPTDFSSEVKASSYKLLLSENSDMSGAKIYSPEENSPTEFSVYNLNIDTTYFYSFKATTDSPEESFSTVMSFDMEKQAPRNLYISGVTNVRDIGGWKIDGGDGRVAQNLIYRSARLHEEGRTLITEKGISQIKELGIKTEIDLRNHGEDGNYADESPVEGVTYRNFPMEYGKSLFEYELNVNSLRDTFITMSDINNLPLVFHCAIGTDRTGFVGFVLNALAGISEDDLIRDYLFSCFGNIGGKRYASKIESYISTFFETYKGNTLSQSTANYLLSIGLSSEQVGNLKNILLGDRY